MKQFVQVESEYGELAMWLDVAVGDDGVPCVVEIEIVRYEPSAQLRHNVISDYRATGRKRVRVHEEEGYYENAYLSLR